MIVVEAPNKYDMHVGEIGIFLGGGISNCPDWQEVILDIFEQRVRGDSVVIFNPRRKDFDITNPDVSQEQIEWEFKHLEQSDLVLFWFPHETLCPITLFELGKMIGINQNIIVGCHPDYQRVFDIKCQLSLDENGRNVIVVDSLEALASQALEFMYNRNKKIVKFI